MFGETWAFVLRPHVANKQEASSEHVVNVSVNDPEPLNNITFTSRFYELTVTVKAVAPVAKVRDCFNFCKGDTTRYFQGDLEQSPAVNPNQVVLFLNLTGP